MAQLSIKSRISKAEKTAEFWEKKGRQNWAKAKNGGAESGHCYNRARIAYERAAKCRAAAESYRNQQNKEG